MFVGGDFMLEDYEIRKPVHKKFIVLEFVLILLIIQSAIMLITGNDSQEAMQFRIIAHSNTAADQLEKEEVYEAVKPLLQEAMASAQSNEELVERLTGVAPLIIEQATAIVPGKSITFERRNAVIPPKRSGFYIQPQADYDAYLLTIGSGRGDNWWCSLFPNICFPAEEEVVVEVEEEKVTFFLWEWIKGLFA